MARSIAFLRRGVKSVVDVQPSIDSECSIHCSPLEKKKKHPQHCGNEWMSEEGFWPDHFLLVTERRNRFQGAKYVLVWLALSIRFHTCGLHCFQGELHGWAINRGIYSCVLVLAPFVHSFMMKKLQRVELTRAQVPRGRAVLMSPKMYYLNPFKSPICTVYWSVFKGASRFIHFSDSWTRPAKHCKICQDWGRID